MLKEQVAGILEKYFNDPIEIPCPYCEANKEILNLFKAQIEKLTVIEDEEISQAKKGHTAIIQAHPSVYPQDTAVAKAQLQADKDKLLDLMEEK